MPNPKPNPGRHRFTHGESIKGAETLNALLTAEQRSESARKAVRARWAKWAAKQKKTAGAGQGGIE